MDILQAILLGFIEGLTEFLPVSSTGHLIVAEEYIKFKDTARIFTIVIQLGAISAVIWHYRADLSQKAMDFFRGKSYAKRFWLNLFIATLPGGILGLLLSTSLEEYAQPVLVATMLILGAFVLLWVDKIRPVQKNQKIELEKIQTKQAVFIGLAQAAALFPGVSRSGASIVGGVLSGLNRVSATAFSFYLAIPILAVAGAFKLLSSGGDVSTVDGGWGSIIAGSITSFIVALIAISWLLKYVSNHGFKIFAIYRIVLGIVILITLV